MSEKKSWWHRLLGWLGFASEVADTAESIRAEMKEARKKEKRRDESFRILPLAVLALVLVAADVHAAGRAILSWDANTEADLAGYKVYMGTATGVYGPPTDVGKTATPLAPRHTIEPLPDGAYFFAVTAYDTSGNESGFSNEVSKTIDSTPPKPPFNLRALIEKIIAAIRKLFGAG